MKILLALFLSILITSSFTACSLSSEFSDDLLNVKKEATEAVTNLTNEATQAYEAVETKVDQFNQAAKSVSNALDAVQQAKNDIGTFTSGSDENEESEASTN